VRSRPWLDAYCLVVGAIDGATGVLLVWAPELTLGLMGITTVPPETIFLRFIGAFVAAVGLLYWLPLLPPRTGYERRRVVLEATALVRTCVGCFVFAAIVSGSLEPSWFSVSAFDLALAATQVIALGSTWSQA
jgi:hypothetical protein